MDILYLDFETRSVHDINDVGLHRYLADKTTSALLLSYAFNDGAVDIWARHRTQKLPGDVLDVINDPKIKLCAWNAGFERHVFGYLFGIEIDCRRFLDPSIMARHLSIPGSLDMAGRTLGLPADMLKMAEEGERLIKKFSMPVDAGGEKTLFGMSEPVFRNWNTDAEDWILFESYCKQDTTTEREIFKRLQKFPLPDIEWENWYLDQKINDCGIPVDLKMVEGSLSIVRTVKTELLQRIKDISGVENPNANPQILDYVRKNGYSFGSLSKPMVARALGGECSLNAQAKEVLLLRKQSAKTSYKKLEAVKMAVSSDGRLRDQFAFMGAARTARFSGRLVQPQNLPRPGKEIEKNMERALEILRAGDYMALSLEFDTPPMEAVSSCTRGMFRAPKGSKFKVCDLKAIENRVLGWMAKCDAIFRVFREGLDPYIDFATDLYNKPYDQVTSYERQMSKPAILGCGYALGGGEEILNEDGDRIKTGLLGYASSLGVEMTREDAHKAVQVFRRKFSEVVDLWYAMENAAKTAMRTHEEISIGVVGEKEIELPVRFKVFGKNKILRMQLPSGRGIHYIRPRIEKIEFNGRLKDTITYEGVDQKTGQWTRIRTYGGRLVENADQSISRDILLCGMREADKRGFEICLHAHDEICALVPDSSPLTVADLRECMIKPIEWASDLPLDAEGFESEFYKKG